MIACSLRPPSAHIGIALSGLLWLVGPWDQFQPMNMFLPGRNCNCRCKNFQGILFLSCGKSESETVSHSIVSDSATSWTVAHQTFLSMWFSRQEYWSGCHFLLLGIEPRSPALQADSLLPEAPGKHSLVWQLSTSTALHIRSSWIAAETPWQPALGIRVSNYMPMPIGHAWKIKLYWLKPLRFGSFVTSAYSSLFWLTQQPSFWVRNKQGNWELWDGRKALLASPLRNYGPLRLLVSPDKPLFMECCNMMILKPCWSLFEFTDPLMILEGMTFNTWYIQQLSAEILNKHQYRLWGKSGPALSSMAPTLTQGQGCKNALRINFLGSEPNPTSFTGHGQIV